MTEPNLSQEELHTHFDKLENLEQGITDAECAHENALRDLSLIAGKTFLLAGQWYQIRERVSKKKNRTVHYLVLLRDNPKTWLSVPRKNVDKLQGGTADLLEQSPEARAQVSESNGGSVEPVIPLIASQDVGTPAVILD